MYDEIDLEELECRLYCQIYHSSAEIEGNVPLESPTATPEHRYFSQQDNFENLTFISLESVPSCDNEYHSFDTVTNANFHLNISNRENSDYYSQGNITNPLDVPKNLPDQLSIKQIKQLKRRKKNRERRWKKNRQKCQRVLRSHTRKNIELTDTACITIESDNSDCEVVKDMCKKRLNDEHINNTVSSGDDDDIIYIPPPPLEVINVDIDEEPTDNTNNFENVKSTDNFTNDLEVATNIQNADKSLQEDQNTQITELSASNDFLETSEVPGNGDNFNFSLHGSDFTNEGDFVKPTNPIEYCETESSCSTNDFNKDFSNSMNTTVFNEIEFPREDIFSDKNLETFSSYITPQRSTVEKIKTKSLSPSKAVKKIVNDESDSSISSSESDYEVSVPDSECNKLPTLSPMCDKMTITGAKLSNMKSTLKSKEKQLHVSTVSAKNAKRKSTELQSTELGSDNGGDGSKYSKKKSSKKITNKKKPLSKNSNKDSINKNQVDDQMNGESIVSRNSENVIVSHKRKKKTLLKSHENETEDTTPLANISESCSGKVKKKKRKSLCSESSGNEKNIQSKQSEIETITTGISSNNDNNCSFVHNEESYSSISKVDDRTEPSAAVVNYKDDDHLTEKPKEIFHRSSTPINILDGGDEVIVINEDSSKCFGDDLHSAILVSSDSECDNQQDVGHDLALANCSVTDKYDIIDFENEGFTSIRNIGICEDYSKFDVEQIQNTQSDDPQYWEILPSDRTCIDIRRNKGPRCNRCREFGHIALRCTIKPNPPNCSLCGTSGHQEPRCPNKKCTQCGNQGDYSTTFCWKCFKFRDSTCHICKMKGHIAKFCPDLWRRYHLTTKEGPIVVADEPQLKPRIQFWCSGCAGQGHLEHECHYYNREYPPTSPCVMSYEDVLHKENRESPEKHSIPSCSSTPTSSALPTLPTPPVWNSPNQSSYKSVPSPLPYLSFSSQVYMPPVLPQISYVNKVFTAPSVIGQNDLLLPNNNINCTININSSASIPNPLSVPTDSPTLDQMMFEFVNSNDQDDDQKRVKPSRIPNVLNIVFKSTLRRTNHIIMTMPCHAVKDFLIKELDIMNNVVRQISPKYLKKILFKCDRLINTRRPLKNKFLKEVCFWFRILNMFIFGVHQFNNGKFHMDVIMNYIYEPKPDESESRRRRLLLASYNYIFQGERHNANYLNFLRRFTETDVKT